jgi:hypothetical protein
VTLDQMMERLDEDRLENDDRLMRHLAQAVRNGMGDRAGTCIDPTVQVVDGKTVCHARAEATRPTSKSRRPARCSSRRRCSRRGGQAAWETWLESSLERIDHRHADVLEVPAVACDHGEAVNQGGGGNQTVFYRHRTAGGPETRQELGTAQPVLRFPR